GEAGAEPRLAFTGDVMTPVEVMQRDERWLATHERLLREYPLVTSEALAQADGAIFGSPTRFGNMAAQLKNYLDSLAGVWLSGATIGKPAGAFVSTGSLHGGQETTAFTMYAPLIHLGFIIVGVPYSNAELLTTTTGGTPYGPSHVAQPMGDRPPDETELHLCRVLGRRVAEIATVLAQRVA
ncbi:MAG: NAD(P)H:quinone oxidoreductase, partial [Armatimonadetes bacterium]|nr:NAD(P)H:quinone oxidoreductase [Armatimonadota bacterium]